MAKDQQPPASQNEKWTEIEYLPTWDEPYYDIYTAKKHGKWVMLKTLKKELRDKTEFQAMLSKEFSVRYNLSHPNIVMINDFEDVPGVGMSIITDDVYGPSLATLLKKGELSDKHYEQLCSRLPQAMEYIQINHLAHNAIKPETIIFTENIGNLKLIDVGFDQSRSLSHADTNDDIVNYGRLMLNVLKSTGRRDPHMFRIANRCVNGGYRDVQALQMAISGRSFSTYYLLFFIAMLSLTAIIVWLLTHPVK